MTVTCFTILGLRCAMVIMAFFVITAMSLTVMSLEKALCSLGPCFRIIFPSVAITRT